MIPTWKIGAVQVLGLGCLGVVAGTWVKCRIPLLDRLNIPVPIVGGMLYAVATLVLRDRVVNFDADVVLRDLLQTAFMTTIGLGARLQLIRVGGLRVTWNLAISTLGALLQNLLGMGMARLLGIDVRLGILAGSVALAGGPATSLAFGGTFEELGVHGATTVAFASATFGIAVAGLIGGYIGGHVIRRNRLRGAPSGSKMPAAEDRHEPGAPSARTPLLGTVMVLGVSMGAGSLVSFGLQRLGLILPVYIGAMIVAAVSRNLDDRWHFAYLSQVEVDDLGRISLYCSS